MDRQERDSIEISTFYAYEELLSWTGVLEEDIPVLLSKEEGQITSASDTGLTKKYVDYSDTLRSLRGKDGISRLGTIIPMEVQEEVVLQPGQRTPINSSR